MSSRSRSEAAVPMSTTTASTATPATGHGAAEAGRMKARGRGERSRTASLASHGILTVASLIAFFPVAWLVYLSLGPDKDDYLHPGGIWSKMTFSNYSFVLQHTEFFDWLKSSLIVSLGTTVIGVLIAATTGYAVSRMR